jgi:hypothetical protein
VIDTSNVSEGPTVSIFRIGVATSIFFLYVTNHLPNFTVFVNQRTTLWLFRAVKTQI